MRPSDASHEAVLRIARSHPSLPGHFPGRPLVPGVLLLESVLQAAERWLDRPLEVRGLPLAKFNAPLLPEQEARLLLYARHEELRFRILRGDTLLAQGAFTLASETAA
jgi:3-hydroxymyristoyl/3-hydroxydecanoyl-(acyl carrier protein) dehydratase